MTASIQVAAPLTGTVETVLVKSGDIVSIGDVLILMESMKVHVQVKAENNGKVANINAITGSTVNRGDILVSLEAVDASQVKASTASNTPTNEPHSSLSKFEQRQSLALDHKRTTARDKRHAKGFSTARENLSALCGADEFNEYGQFAVAAQRKRQNYEELKTSAAADGIITGVGKINQSLVGEEYSQTAIVINDYSVMAGTQGFFHHQKLDRILEIAGKQKLPVIMYCEGGGGRPGDTDVTTVISGLQCASFGTWAGLSGVVPRISVANGYNFAGNAALFGAADITIATKGSNIGMAGPAMIEGGGLGQFKPTEIGPVETQSRNGVVDIIADNEPHAAALAKKALSYFQGRQSAPEEADQCGLRMALPENRRMTYDVRSIIELLSDPDSFLELKPNYGGSIVTGFARIKGQPLGVLANDCSVLGGAIDVASGEKAAQFIGLCNQFNIPLISLCDTPGFMVGPEHEELGAVRRLAALFTAGAKLKVPLVAVILRKCYGLGAQAMLGGSTSRPNYTLAWPTGEFGAMGLEGAVKLGFKKELEAIQDPVKQQQLFDKLLAKQYERGQAAEVASVLEIDAVIDPADTRKAIIQALAF